MRLVPIGEPIRPVSMREILLHLRIEEDAEELELEQVESYVDAALEWAADFTRRSVLLQGYRLTLPSAGQEISLPKPALHEVTRVAVGGEELGASDYEVNAETWPGMVRLKSPPSGEVVIEYQAGYTEATLPRKILQATKLLTGHWYANREEGVVGTTAAEVPMAAKALLWMSRMGL